MRVRKFHIYLTLVMASTGFLIANSIELTQLRKKEHKNEQQWQQETQLNEWIIDKREKNTKLEAQLLQSQREITEIEEQVARQQSEAARILEELEEARMIAGVVQVEGPGVVVTMRDNPKSTTSEDIAKYIVHEQDIWRVVNELFAAGAEGVSVNGQRLVSTSAIRCVGPTVIVNGIKSAAPFVITAIGDPPTLDASLHLPGGVIDWLQGFVEIEVQKKDMVQLPAYVGESNVSPSQSS